jgi:hypothetical protein
VVSGTERFGRFSGGEKVYQVEVHPRTGHCEIREDPVSGGNLGQVPGEEQPQEESGAEIIHEAQEQRESTPRKAAGTPQNALPVPITQIRPTIGFMVEVTVQRVPVHAVVDTGAEVSVLSKQVYDELDPRPPIKQYVTMSQAGDNARMNGFVVGQEKIQLGSAGYCGDLQRKVCLDLGNGLMISDWDTFPMLFGRTE